MKKVITTFLILLAFASVASADDIAGVDRGKAVGQQLWGSVCAYTVGWDQPLSATDGSWAAHALSGSGCHIGFNALYADASFMHDPAWVCTLLVHEIGHLAGQQHSDDPLSVMHAPPLRVQPGCESTTLAKRPQVSMSHRRWHWRSSPLAWPRWCRHEI